MWRIMMKRSDFMKLVDRIYEPTKQSSLNLNQPATDNDDDDDDDDKMKVAYRQKCQSNIIEFHCYTNID